MGGFGGTNYNAALTCPSGYVITGLHGRFGTVIWGGFFLAMSLTGWGLFRMEINETYKAFLGVSWLYLITCTFTLAKSLRDAHEADLADAHRQGRSSAPQGGVDVYTLSRLREGVRA